MIHTHKKTVRTLMRLLSTYFWLCFNPWQPRVRHYCGFFMKDALTFFVSKIMKSSKSVKPKVTFPSVRFQPPIPGQLQKLIYSKDGKYCLSQALSPSYLCFLSEAVCWEGFESKSGLNKKVYLFWLAVMSIWNMAVTVASCPPLYCLPVCVIQKLLP